MNEDFKSFFMNWMEDKPVIFLTGSDKEKTIEQIGEDLWNRSYVSMQSCGNQIFRNGLEIYRSQWCPSEDLIEYLKNLLDNSQYKMRFGNHIEERIGLLNFCIPGRNCSQEIRDSYYKWDHIKQERLKFSEFIMRKFPDLEASVGGQISIDIHEKGSNKSQAKKWIMEEFGPDTTIHFFGDKTDKGGNDYDLAKLLNYPHKVHSVLDWRETYRELKNLI
jgi:phosphomannomutase